jgi:hypothetical protein
MKWLEKITAALPAKNNRVNLPAVRRNQPPVFGQSQDSSVHLGAASIIYGVAASVLLLFGVYLVISGLWFTGVLVCVVGIGFFGYALHFMRN